MLIRFDIDYFFFIFQYFNIYFFFAEDLDLRVLAVPGKRPSPDMLDASSAKKTKAEKFDA